MLIQASDKYTQRSTVDFVLLSEFSELEGPVPLFRIPESAAPTFNVNDFVLRCASVTHVSCTLVLLLFSRAGRVLEPHVLIAGNSIMAVDHQASKAKEHACLIPDTQVVLSEPDDNIHAYVCTTFQIADLLAHACSVSQIHHFSLLDIHARGYVRPYAMVYLSESPVKIATQFEGLLKQFSSVSAMLKESNSALFISA
jgi:hypothetical protein